jgi:hypothetical protein
METIVTEIPGLKGQMVEDEVRIYDGERLYSGELVHSTWSMEELTLQTGENREDYEWVTDPVSIDHVGTSVRLEKASISKVGENTYCSKDYSDARLGEVVEEIKDADGQLFVPEVYPTGEGTYEIVDGHRTFNALLQMDKDDIWVRVLEKDDEWDYVREFVDDHFPEPGENGDRPRGRYTDSQVVDSVEKMTEDWPIDLVMGERRIASNIERIMEG